MTAQECCRIQGISKRNLSGLSANFIRKCVGNAMSVRIVSMLISAAFELMKPFTSAPLRVAQPATIENSRVALKNNLGSLVSPKPKRKIVPSKFSELCYTLQCTRSMLRPMREAAKACKGKIPDLTKRLYAQNVEIVYAGRLMIDQQQP